MTFLKSELASFFYIYLLGNIFLLLNYEGIYWDDWVLYNVESNSVLSMFHMHSGILLEGYTHLLLLSIGNGVFIYRILVFLAFIIIGTFLYKILSKYIVKSHNSAFWIVLIYLTIPLNSAKIALINAPYTFFLFLFFLAFYMLTRYLVNKRLILSRIGILLLFFLSFMLGSLLVFYAIVLLYIVYSIVIDVKRENNSNQGITIAKRFMFGYVDFIMLPIIFYVLTKIYFQPYGLYENYNATNFDFLKITYLMKTSLTTSIYEPILFSIQTSFNYWYIFIFVLGTIYFISQSKTIDEKPFTHNIVLFILGALFYILAVFPYAVVGKLPQLGGWDSRHQILIPLAIAFMLYAVVSLFSRFNKHIAPLVLSLLITVFTIQNMYNGYRYIQDWYYQVALEENFKLSKTIQNHTTFVTKIDLPDVLVNKRNLSFYEQNGRLKKVFGIDSRLMLTNEKDIERYKQYKSYKQYNFSKWIYEQPIFLTVSKTNIIDKDPLYILKMFYFQFADNHKFRRMAKKLIKLKEVKEAQHVSR